MSLLICEQADKCGLAEHCVHGQPHVPRRCGCCWVWCDKSNALCNEGLCTQPANRLTERGLEPYEPEFPVKCKVIGERP